MKPSILSKKQLGWLTLSKFRTPLSKEKNKTTIYSLMLMCWTKKSTIWLMLTNNWEPRMNSWRKTINRNKGFLMKHLRTKRGKIKFKNMWIIRKRKSKSSKKCWTKSLLLLRKFWLNLLGPNSTEITLIEFKNTSTQEFILTTQTWLNTFLNSKNTPTAYWFIREKLTKCQTLKSMQRPCYLMS